MSDEYELTVEGALSGQSLLELAVPERAAEATGDGSLRTLELESSLGLTLRANIGTNGYVEAAADEGRWEWEPERYAMVVFGLRRGAAERDLTPGIVAIVDRVLAGTEGDTAFVQGDEVLLLTRTGGTVRRHHAGWWEGFGGSAGSFG